MERNSLIESEKNDEIEKEKSRIVTPESRIIRYLQEELNCQIRTVPRADYEDRNPNCKNTCNWFVQVWHPKYGNIEILCQEPIANIANMPFDKIRLAVPFDETANYELYVEEEDRKWVLKIAMFLQQRCYPIQ